VPTSTYIVLALRRNGVNKLGLGHVVFVGSLIFLRVLQEVVPCLRRQLWLELCAQHLLFQRLCDGRHDCKSVALQLFCAGPNVSESGIVSEVGVGVDEVAWSEVRCSLRVIARRRLHVPASRCLSEKMMLSGDAVVVRGFAHRLAAREKKRR
jgi:hypothetical protein